MNRTKLLQAALEAANMTCQECGMSVKPNEYHPFAACLMYKGCNSASTVRDNLAFVRNKGKALDAVKEEKGEPCLICQRPIVGYVPEYCCAGASNECGCMGRPIEPCVCSKECDKALMDGIGKPMDERRIAAGIELWKPDTIELPRELVVDAQILVAWLHKTFQAGKIKEDAGIVYEQLKSALDGHNNERE